MTDRMKPPARRTSGRALGGANKATPPPPPPAAELTPEQFAAEQAADHGGDRSAASKPQTQPAPSVVSNRGAAQASAQPTIEIAPSDPVREPAVSQPTRPAIGASEAEMASAAEQVERQAPSIVPAVGLPAASAVQAMPLSEPVAQYGPSPVTSATPDPTTAAEVALRSTAPPTPGVQRSRSGPMFQRLTRNKACDRRQRPAREHHGRSVPAGRRTFLRRPLSSINASSLARVSTRRSPPC